LILTVAPSSNAEWLAIVLSIVAIAISLAAVRYTKDQADATVDLADIEREKLRRLEEPSFRAKYDAARHRVMFTMVTGPTDICEVSVMIPIEDHAPFLDMKSPDSLGFMQVKDESELPANAHNDRPDKSVQQLLLLEVKWKLREVLVSVYCEVPPKPPPATIHSLADKRI
jgi:hypothetical protein